MRHSELTGSVLGEHDIVTLAQVCRVCRVQEQTVVEMVAEGVVEPASGEQGQWRFDHQGVRRLHVAIRLQRDLGVNPAGAALALQLMEEIDRLRVLARHN
nr:MerR family transcriptional regulator [Pseudomonas sp.]